jgi:N-acyl-D-amino-acid deacylase
MKYQLWRTVLPCLGFILITSCGPAPDYDVIIRGGAIYDGSGGAAYIADVAIQDDVIAVIGELDTLRGRIEIDAMGKAVVPGFINMLSWANESLLQDGRSMSDIFQGVTLEVMGEGWSMGPWNEDMKQEEKDAQGDIQFDIKWTTLGEYLQHLEDQGVSTNVASFVGAATVRIHEIGYEDRDATPEEMDRMKALVRQAMEEGAVGLSTALEYTPASYAPTEELINLAMAADEYDGMFIAHLRNEDEEIFPALEEFFTIIQKTGIRGEIYHLKVSRKQNWDKLDEIIQRIEAKQAAGLHLGADIYTYVAGATGLDIMMPGWVQEGGHEAWVERLKDPVVRDRLKTELDIYPPENILLTSFRNSDLRDLTGKTLAEVATIRGTSPEDTMMDLIIQDNSSVGIVIFIMSEENVRKKIAQPWMSFCSDAGSIAPEKPFTNSQPHPRAYGSFARLLGKYVREEKVIPLEEAIRRLTHFPATNLRLDRRGLLAVGYFADVVVFDPETIIDHATFQKPHQLASGVEQVFVNGEQVLKNGRHTGAMPGRFVKGPGWTGKQ